MNLKKNLQKFVLPLQERDRRWEMLRLGMVMRGVDCLLVFGNEGDRYNGQMANLKYITNLQARGFCLFPLEGEPIAFVGTQNQFLPNNYFSGVQDWIDDVRSTDSGLKGSGLEGLLQTIKDWGMSKAHIGLVDGNEKEGSALPYKIHKKIVASLPEARFSDQTSLLTQARLIKGEEEIKLLRRAGVLAKEMMLAMRGTAKVGAKESDLYNEMMRVHMDGGGDPHSFILIASGPIGEDVHLLHGKLPPYCPSERTLKKDDLIIVEFHAVYGGYIVAAEDTVFLGNPPPELSSIHSVAIQSFQNGLALMREGVPFNVVIEAYQEPVLKAGMKWLELGLHQHGLSSGGFPTAVYPPGMPKYLPIRKETGELANVSSFKLREGMVFGQNIDIHDPFWNKGVGVMLGDTVLVTSGEPEVLCQAPLNLELH